MKPFLTSSLAALAGALTLAGCVVAPVEGPYAYGYSRPYYYDQGPVYYDPWPGYYYGSPAIVGRFRFDGGDRERHWSGGSWRHNSMTLNSDNTRPRASRFTRGPAAGAHGGTGARVHRNAVRRDSDKS